METQLSAFANFVYLIAFRYCEVILNEIQITLGLPLIAEIIELSDNCIVLPIGH